MARPTFFGISGRVTGLRAVDEEAVPASAPAYSRLFVLPVAARRWVSTDNTASEAFLKFQFHGPHPYLYRNLGRPLMDFPSKAL